MNQFSVRFDVRRSGAFLVPAACATLTENGRTIRCQPGASDQSALCGLQKRVRTEFRGARCTAALDAIAHAQRELNTRRVGLKVGPSGIRKGHSK